MLDSDGRSTFYSKGDEIHTLGSLTRDPVACGTEHTEPTDVNDNGEVVGISNCRAFIWNETFGLKDLNSLVDDTAAGWLLYSANGINESGQIVGEGRRNGETRAFVLTPK